MALVASRAIVLRRYRLGETSRVIVCYTRDYGKVRLVAKGVRKGGGRFGGALEPFVVSGVVFYLTPGRGLSLVSQAGVEQEFQRLRADVTRQSYAAAALELLNELVPDYAPDPALFDLAERALERFNDAAPDRLDHVLWHFEMDLAALLGYAPELGLCVVCERPAGAGASLSAAAGGAVCRACAERRGLADAGGGALRLLRDLAAGRDAGDVTGALRDEVDAFLADLWRSRVERDLNLRALRVRAALERIERERGGPGTDHDEEA
jgi:DNA repair protein RecO (recombination protein O)